MSLFYPMEDFSDFTETVTVSRPKAGWTKTVYRATKINPGRSETGFLASKKVPHIKTIWSIPTSVGIDLQRGDRVTDESGRMWIIVEPVRHERFRTFRCRCVCETLEPGPDDFIDLYRLESFTDESAAVTLVAANLVAVPYSQNWKTRREDVDTTKTVQDDLVFLVKTAIDLVAADVLRRKGDGAVYEILSTENAPLHSDWGELIVRRTVGRHGLDVFPNGF